jgi:hypothetical protein
MFLESTRRVLARFLRIFRYKLKGGHDVYLNTSLFANILAMILKGVLKYGPK